MAYLGRSPLPQASTPGFPVYKEYPLQTPSQSLGDNGLGVFSGSFCREKLTRKGLRKKCLCILAGKASWLILVGMQAMCTCAMSMCTCTCVLSACSALSGT